MYQFKFLLDGIKTNSDFYLDTDSVCFENKTIGTRNKASFVGEGGNQEKVIMVRVADTRYYVLFRNLKLNIDLNSMNMEI